MNFQMFKLVLQKADEPEIKLPTSTGSLKAKEFQKNIYFCFIDYAKAFDCVDHNKLWKILKEREIPDHLICFLRNLYADQEQQMELDMEQQTGSKLGPMDCSTPGFPVHHQLPELLKLMSVESVMPSSHSHMPWSH